MKGLKKKKNEKLHQISVWEDGWWLQWLSAYWTVYACRLPDKNNEICVYKTYASLKTCTRDSYNQPILLLFGFFILVRIYFLSNIDKDLIEIG